MPEAELENRKKDARQARILTKRVYWKVLHIIPAIQHSHKEHHMNSFGGAHKRSAESFTFTCKRVNRNAFSSQDPVSTNADIG